MLSDIHIKNVCNQRIVARLRLVLCAKVSGKLFLSAGTIRLGAAGANKAWSVKDNPTASWSLIKPQSRSMALSSHAD
jgi:hypothetical protein